MKITFKKFLSAFLAVLMIAAVVPFSASAANYKNPVFTLKVTAETDTTVTVALNLESGKFNCVDFAFVAAKGYTCTKIQKGAALQAFEKENQASLCSANPATGFVAFVLMDVYSKSGEFFTAVFSKTKGKAYKAGDIKIEFSNCAIMDKDDTIDLIPTMGFELDKTEVEVNYGTKFTVKASADGCKWSTSNKKVATVDSNGNVKAVGRGTAVITATLDGVSVDCKVTVKFTFGQWILYIVCFGWIWM